MLSADEIQLLAKYLFDKATQQELALERGVSQQRMSVLIRTARRKLAAAKIDATFPTRGRRPEPKFHSIEGDAIDRLVMDDDGDHGQRRGHWQDATKVQRG